MNVNAQAVEFAIAKIDVGTTFEGFGKNFSGTALGYSFSPLVGESGISALRFAS